jgi:DNA-binding response OmpR family regulator
LILDLGLPKMSGLEVLRRLRARNSHLPVLILTAADSVEQRVKGLDLVLMITWQNHSLCPNSKRVSEP